MSSCRPVSVVCPRRRLAPLSSPAPCATTALCQTSDWKNAFFFVLFLFQTKVNDDCRHKTYKHTYTHRIIHRRYEPAIVMGSLQSFLAKTACSYLYKTQGVPGRSEKRINFCSVRYFKHWIFLSNCYNFALYSIYFWFNFNFRNVRNLILVI